MCNHENIEDIWIDKGRIMVSGAKCLDCGKVMTEAAYELETRFQSAKPAKRQADECPGQLWEPCPICGTEPVHLCGYCDKHCTYGINNSGSQEVY
jgi:hypothetical protein